MALNCRELNGYGDRESALCVRQWVLIQDHLFICLVLLSVCAFETRPQRKVRDQRCDLNLNEHNAKNGAILRGLHVHMHFCDTSCGLNQMAVNTISVEGPFMHKKYTFQYIFKIR